MLRNDDDPAPVRYPSAVAALDAAYLAGRPIGAQVAAGMSSDTASFLLDRGMGEDAIREKLHELTHDLVSAVFAAETVGIGWSNGAVYMRRHVDMLEIESWCLNYDYAIPIATRDIFAWLVRHGRDAPPPTIKRH